MDVTRGGIGGWGLWRFTGTGDVKSLYLVQVALCTNVDRPHQKRVYLGLYQCETQGWI